MEDLKWRVRRTDTRLQLVCKERWCQILDLDITKIASHSAPSRNVVIDLSTNRIKQKYKSEVDKSKVEKE